MRNSASPGTHPERAPYRRALRAGALVLLTLAPAACSGKAPGRTAAAADSLVLGLPIPLTDGAGNADIYGENARLGAELAQREINANGGVGGRPVAFRVLDDEGDGQTAIRVADELADAGVVAVVGHVYSGATLAAANIYEEREVPAVATTATSPDITALGPWIFRLASSDSANAVQLAQAARAMGLRTEVLYVNEDYGRGLARVFTSAYRAAGGTLSGTAPYLESTPDFRPYLERLRSRGAGLVFVAGNEAGAARLIAQARELGVNARFMGGDGIEALTDRGATFDGTLVGMLFHRDATDEAKRFTREYRAAFKRDPDSVAALTYDAVHLLARGMAEGHTSRRALRRWLESVGTEGGAPAFDGAGGRVAFDENGDPQDKQFFVGSIQNGGIQLSRGVQ